MINDLTNGSINKKLLKIAIPVMGSSLFQMAYQIIDMFWLGKLSSGSVAAVGTAGFFIALSYAIGSLAFIGTGIKISHAIGQKHSKEAGEFIVASMVLIITISTIVTLGILYSKESLIYFFNLNSDYIYNGAVAYLGIVITFSIFKNISMTFNSIFMGFGTSKIPFIVGSVALVINIILDPILIFYFDMGIKGAAYATVIAQVISALLLIIIFLYSTRNNRELKTSTIKLSRIKTILKLSYPVTIQRVIFSGIYIIIGRIISSWGSDAITIQKIGVQLESLSYVTAGGMRAAMSSFVGQNFGAKKLDRVKKGYVAGLFIMTGVGIFVSLTFLLLPEQIFSLFIKNPEVIKGGATYLKILAISQIFMCIDIMTMGAFDGLGKTNIPPIVSIGYSLLRIPLALILSQFIGINGIWIAISVTTILRGTTLSTLFFKELRKRAT